MLHELRERGVRTAVCTNKVEHIGSDILERFDLRRYFDAVVGSGGDRPMKPDPRPIIEAVARAGGRMERALLVGDTGADHGAAIAARIPLVLLDYGYSHVPINALTYGIIVDNPIADSIEYRPPTQSQNSNMLAVSMPNFWTSAAFVDTATKCFATAVSSPNVESNQCRAVCAFVIVSSVVNVFDATMNNVSAGSRSTVFS